MMHRNKFDCPRCVFGMNERGEWREEAYGKRPRVVRGSDVSDDEAQLRRTARLADPICREAGGAHEHGD